MLLNKPGMNVCPPDDRNILCVLMTATSFCMPLSITAHPTQRVYILTYCVLLGYATTTVLPPHARKHLYYSLTFELILNKRSSQNTQTTRFTMKLKFSVVRKEPESCNAILGLDRCGKPQDFFKILRDFGGERSS